MFVGLSAFLVFPADTRRFLDAITFAGDGDGLGMVQEPVQDRTGSGHIAQEFTRMALITPCGCLGNHQPVKLLRPGIPVGETEIGRGVGHSAQRGPSAQKIGRALHVVNHVRQARPVTILR